MELESGDDGVDITAAAASKARCTASGSLANRSWPFATVLEAMAHQWLTFDRQVAQIELRIAILNRDTALGIPVTEPVG